MHSRSVPDKILMVVGNKHVLCVHIVFEKVSESDWGVMCVGIWGHLHSKNKCWTYSVLPVSHLLRTVTGFLRCVLPRTSTGYFGQKETIMPDSDTSGRGYFLCPVKQTRLDMPKAFTQSMGHLGYSLGRSLRSQYQELGARRIWTSYMLVHSSSPLSS